MDNKNCIQNNPSSTPAHAAFSCAPNIKAATQTRPCTQEWWQATKKDPMVAEVINRIARLNQELEAGEIIDNDYREEVKALKEKLSVACFNANFTDGHRCQESAVATGKLVFDFDHVDNPQQLWKLIGERLKALGLEQLVCLAEVSPSGKGLHVVIIIPQDLDAASAHQWFSELLGPLGANIDHAVKDLARAVYMVPGKYTLYENPSLLFTDHSQPENRPVVPSAEAWLSRQRPSPDATFTPCREAATPFTPSDKAAQEAATPFIPYEQAAQEAGSTLSAPAYNGIPYSRIIRHWLRLHEQKPVPGSRNKVLYALACDLGYLCNHDEPLLLSIMPHADPPLSNSEMVKIVKSACRPSARELKVSNTLLQAIAEAQAEMEQEEEADESAPVHPIYAAAPPPLPKKLPPLVKMFTAPCPHRVKPMIANGIFSPLSAYSSEVYYMVFNDERPKTNNLIYLVVGESSSGKGFLKELINQITKRMRERDKASWNEIKKFNEEKGKKGKLKGCKPRPKAPIQYLPSNITQAALVSSLENLGTRPGYIYTPEIDNLKSFGGDGKSYENISRFFRAIFDRDECSQLRVNADAVTAKAIMNLVITASTTPNMYLAVFRTMLTNGVLSRINIDFLPNREFGAEMIKVKAYPDDFQEQLKPILDNLENTKGTINYKKLVDLSRELEEEMRQLEGKTEDPFLREMRQRAQEIALWKCVVLFVANGCRWDPTFKPFVKWSLYHDLWCKNLLFRKAWEEQHSRDNEHLAASRKREGYLKYMPDTFTKQDLEDYFKKNNITTKDPANTINSWTHRNRIVRGPNHTYRKVKNGHSGKEGK